jgi:hypothetical protein
LGYYTYYISGFVPIRRVAPMKPSGRSLETIARFGLLGSIAAQHAVLWTETREYMEVMPRSVLEMPPQTASMEPHYSVAQVAEQWGVSKDTVRRMFEHEPGVLVIEPERGGMSRRRRYRTLRIPAAVVERVHRMHLVVIGGR